MFKNLPPQILTLAILLGAASFSQAQTTYTEPSGFVKHDLAVGFNLISVGVHQQSLFKGGIG